MKCATERAGDKADAAEIIKKFDVNWDIVIKESLEQSKITEYIYPVFLYDFLLVLKEDLKVDIPDKVIKEVMKIGEDEMVRRFKK